MAIAPGPNISGIASGTKATFPSPLDVAFEMMELAAPDGINSEKPIRIRMMPRFTEGFDTQDLRDAKALLDQLA